MKDAHDLGLFDALEKVWDAYPYGGCPGDYVTIGGVIVRWNDGRRVWGNSGDDISSTETQHVEGNLIVDNDLTVGGKTKGDTAEFKNIKVETLEVRNPPYALKEHNHDEDYAAKAHKHELKDVIGAGDGVVIPGKIEYAEHADKAHDIDEDSPVNERFVSATEDDQAAGLIEFLKGLVSEGLIEANNGLVVRKTEVVEDNLMSLTEENEDVFIEEMNISGEVKTLGELTNVNEDVDTATLGSLFVKGDNWEAVPPVLSSLADYDNMLMSVFHKVLGKWVFISVSSISGGVTPPVTLEMVLDTGLLDVNKLA